MFCYSRNAYFLIAVSTIDIISHQNYCSNTAAGVYLKYFFDSSQTVIVECILSVGFLDFSMGV